MVSYLPKHCVFTVQMWGRAVGDIELAPIGAGPPIGHAHDTPSIMPEGVSNLVLKIGTVDGLASFSLSSWIATLNDKAGDIPVERGRVVI